MTTTQTVKAHLTRKSLSLSLRRIRAWIEESEPESRILIYAETARRDPVPALIEAWAEVQTEALMREILGGGMAWSVFRFDDAMTAYLAGPQS